MCEWCGKALEPGKRRDTEVCDVVCRKRRWRFRRALGIPGRSRTRRPVHQVGPAARFAYADPPYPGKHGKYPENTPVDHEQLVRRLVDGYPDGWALSTSGAALPAVLAVCPPDVRVAIWRRQVRRTRSKRALSAYEALILRGGRELPTDEPQELLDVLDYRGRYDSYPGALEGMKPPEFAVWMFRLLGAAPGDELDDLFPGSTAVSRAWALYTSRLQELDASPLEQPEPSPSAAAHTSRLPGEASREYSVDARDASRATTAKRDGNSRAARPPARVPRPGRRAAGDRGDRGLAAVPPPGTAGETQPTTTA